MATREYIGARYVPKFYQNTVDGSTQWQQNVVYEPLMWVTLTNGHMYISKKQVPATVGTPAENLDYWLDIGSYNGLIVDLQNQIDAIVTELADIITANETSTGETYNGKYVYSVNGSEITSSGIISMINSAIERLKVTSSSNPALNLQQNSDVLGSKIDGNGGIAVNINSTYENVLIHENEIDSNDYGVLINNAANGANATITDNVISSGGDAVEINTPYNEATQDASKTIISNNHLKSDAQGTMVGAGFAVGIARGREVVVNNNIISESREEAFHVEDNTTTTIINGNVAVGCKSYGTFMSTNYSDNNYTVGGLTNGGRPLIFTSNYLQGDNNKTKDGLYLVNSGNDDDAIIVATNNIIENFRIGIYSVSSSHHYHARNYDGCVVIGCNTGIAANQTNNKGKITFSDISGNVVLANGRCHVDSIDVATYHDPATLIGLQDAPTTLSIDEINLNMSQNMQDGNYYKLFKIPSFIEGLLEINCKQGGNHYCRLYQISGSTLTLVGQKTYGAISIDIRVNNGFIEAYTYNQSALALWTCFLHFTGRAIYNK